MLRFITHRSVVSLAGVILSLLTLAGFFATVPIASADGTVTIERGQTMPKIHWSVIGVDTCIPGFDFSFTPYPNNVLNGENIRNTWLGEPRAAIGTETFGEQKALGDMSGSWPQTYVFNCSAGGISDKTTLVINDCSGSQMWDPVNKICSGAVPSASFTPTPSCEIVAGASGCSPTVSWTSANVNGGVTLADCGLGVYATKLVGNQSNSVYVPYNSGCYRIYNGQYSTQAALQTAVSNGITSVLAQTNIGSACASNSTWNSTAGMCISNLPPTVTVTAYTAYGATAGSAYYGEYGTARIQWVATGSGVSCTVYRDGTAIAGPLAYPTVTQYVVPQSRPLVANTTFRVDCSNGNGSGQGTATFTVPPVPTGLSASCAAPGDKLTFNYTLPNGYTKAYIRAYKTPPASISHEAACSPVKSWPDGTCASGQTGSSYTMDSTPGATYYWYMHTQGVLDGNWSDSVTSGAVTCTPTVLPPTPPATISATPGACGTGIINVAWSSVSGATQYELQDGATTIYTGTNTNFSHSGLAAGSNHNYRVRVTTANGTSVYTVPVAANAPAVCTFPNLVSTSLSFFPSSIATGANIYLAGRITNQGGVAAAPFTNGVMYIDANNDGVADYTTPASAVGVSLAPASFADSTANWTVPVAAIPGTQYRFGYFIDPLNTIDEGPGDGPYANWSGWSAPFTVTSTNAPCAAGVSKTWTDGSFTCSAVTQATASGVNGTVVDSTDPTTGSASYQCTNGVWAVTPQTGATCGLTAYPDLVPSVPTVSAATVNQGDSITFRTNTIRNSGNAQAGPHNVGGFYIDYNNDGTADYTVAIPRQTLVTAISGTYTRSVAWTVPANAPALSTYRIGYIVDIDSEVNEASGESNNWSGWSAPFSVTGAPTEPILSNPQHSSVTLTSATVGARLDSTGGSPITASWRGTCLATTPNPTASTPGVRCSSVGGSALGDFSLNYNGLTCGTTYHYTGWADNAVGRGYSPNGTFTTPACVGVPPTTPTNFQANTSPAACGGNINLTWIASPTATSYEYSTNGGTSWTTVPGGTVTAYTVPGLTPDTTYSNLRLRAVNAGGPSGVASASGLASAACTTGNISATSCVIPNGQSVCDSTVSWSISGITTSDLSVRQAGTQFSSDLTGNNVTRQINRGTTIFSLVDTSTGPETLITAVSATADCEPLNSFWNTTTSRCEAKTNPTISANPRLVMAGETTTLTWSTGTYLPTECLISGPGISTPIVPTATSGDTPGVLVTSRSTYTISCQANSARASVTVEVRPSVIES